MLSDKHALFLSILIGVCFAIYGVETCVKRSALPATRTASGFAALHRAIRGIRYRKARAKAQKSA